MNGSDIMLNLISAKTGNRKVPVFFAPKNAPAFQRHEPYYICKAYKAPERQVSPIYAGNSVAVAGSASTQKTEYALWPGNA